jgi:hypothetical protein
MTAPTPAPLGPGAHPINSIAVAANDLAASRAFYSTVFGWKFFDVSPEIATTALASGPAVTLRAGTPPGFQGVVPFLAVPNVEQALSRIAAAGGATEHEPWQVPMAGTLARFTDPAGTIYGLMGAMPAPLPPIPAPFGDAPRPPANTVCSLEMHAGDLDVAGRFFGDVFGWGTQAMMPQFLTFHPGAGIGGVFQSHTAAARGVAYIYVDDVEGSVAAIERAGGTRMGDPMRMPGLACFGYFRDPSGTMMGLMGV